MRLYLAIAGPVWTEAGEAQSAAERLVDAGWALALRKPNLSIWRRADRPMPVVEHDGIVWIGRRIEDPGLTRPAAAPMVPVAERARRICRSGWGAYVGLLHEGERWWVLRDPSGACEALTWTVGPLAFVGAGLAYIPPGLRPPRLALEWDAIADFLRRPTAQVCRSGLTGLHTVAPGDLQPLGAGPQAAMAVWRPYWWMPADAEPDPRWPTRLAETVQSTVSALVSPYARVVTEASGGLDSSIVNAAIARAGLGGRVVEALNFVGDRPEADERTWAEALAEPLGLPLRFAQLETGPFDPQAEFADFVREARPPFAALDGDRDRETASRLDRLQADALVTGKGGDALFFQMPTAKVLADLWSASGFAAACSVRNVEVARWLRRSVWSVLWEAGRRVDGEELGPLARFAGPALLAPSQGAAHPWLADLDGVPPGKRRQLEALAGSQLALGPSRRAATADLVQPLLAQPVMELCLSIPTWELVRGGRDRGLAREAFAGWLPPAVAARRAKGLLSSLYARRLAQSAAAMRAYLLDGVLADARLLDRAAMEAALEPDTLIADDGAVDLVAAAAVEAWVRHWQTRIPDCPQAPRPRLPEPV